MGNINLYVPGNINWHTVKPEFIRPPSRKGNKPRQFASVWENSVGPFNQLFSRVKELKKAIESPFEASISE